MTFLGSQLNQQGLNRDRLINKNNSNVLRKGTPLDYNKKDNYLIKIDNFLETLKLPKQKYKNIDKHYTFNH